jgi:predicted RNA-binding Zn-ribbon protein involved in translation (DUF1610 family)
MIEYIWMLDGEYVQECSSCRSEVPLSEFSLPWGNHRYGNDTKQMLCEFCASSDTADITLYDHLREYRKQAVLTAQAANFTVMKLGGFKSVKSNCPDCGGTGKAYQRLTEMLKNVKPGQALMFEDPRGWTRRACPTCKGVNL